MRARTRRFTSLASGSVKATAVVVCAVMLLAGCGGSGGSATDASTPVIRGDVATTSSLTITGTPATAVFGTPIALTSAGGTGTDAVSYATTSTGCLVTGSSLTATAAGTCAVTATQGTQTGTAMFTFTAATSSLTVSAPGTPAAPTGDAGDGKVTVTVAQGSSGGTPTSYTVTAVDTSKTCTVTGATGSCEVTGLTNATAYTFTATATNVGGTSGVSTPSNSVTPVAAATTATVRTVTFDAGYAGLSRIYTQTGSSPAALMPNTSRWAHRTFLGWNTDPYGHLNNTGEWFADGAVYPFASDIDLYAQWGQPGDPYNIRAQVQGPGKVDVTFSAARNANGGFYTGLTEYELTTSQWFVSSKYVNAEGTYTFDNLSGGDTVFWLIYKGKRFITRPASLDVPAAATSNVMTRPGTPPAPTVVAGTAKITATVAAGTSGGPPLWYTVKAYTVNGTEAGTSCTVARASGSCEVTALTAGSTYTVKASATNMGGHSGQSVASSPVTLAAPTPTVSVPGTPPAPTVVAGTAKVTATVAAGSSGGTPTSYTVKAYTVNGTEAGTSCTVTGASGFCDVTALTAGSTYTVRAIAKNTAGDSGASVASSPVTLATVPGAPGLTALSRRSKTEVWVTFTAPSSNGGAPITGYTVTATRNGVDVTQSFPAEAGRVSVGPLTRYAVYTFTVKAVNSVGTSGPSNASRFTVG